VRLTGMVTELAPELLRIGRLVTAAATAPPARALLTDLGLLGFRVVQGLFPERAHETMIEPSQTMFERLSSEDSRILALESGAIVGHTCKILIAERAGDPVAYLRDRVTHRLALAPRCRQRIVDTPFHLGAPVWVDDPDFDVTRHVRAVPVEGPVTDPERRAIVARLMAERLPRDRPLWALDVVDPLEDARTAAILRIHHAMADGQASMAIGSALIWSDSPGTETDPPPLEPAEPLPSQNALVAAALSDHAQAVGEAAYRIGHGVVTRGRWRQGLAELRRAPTVVRRELVPAHGASPLDAEVGRKRTVAFVDDQLDRIHRAAHAVGDG